MDKKVVLLLIFAAAVIFMGQVPFILRFFHTPPGYYYPLIDKVFPADFVYPAIVRWGMGPEWLVSYPPVWQEHTPSVIYIFYLLLGKIAALLTIGPFEMVAAARVLGGILLATSAWLFFSRILKKAVARLAFVIFLLVEPLPFLAVDARFVPDINHWFWDYGEATRRLSAIPPHYTVGAGLAVLALWCLLRFRGRLQVFAGVFLAAAGFVYASPVVAVLVGSAVALLARRGSRVPLALLILGGAASLLVLRNEAGKGYPWTLWSFETLFNNPSFHISGGYLLQIGLLIGPVALFLYGFRRHVRQAFWWLIAGWGFSALILLPFVDRLGISSYRIVQGGQLVPLAAMAAVGWQMVRSRRGRVLQRLWMGIVIGLFIVYGTATVVASSRRLWGYATNVYFRPAEMAALSYIGTHAKAGSVVLAGLYPSAYIPVFARVRTIIGYQGVYEGRFDEYNRELDAAARVLEGRAKDEEAALYIASRNIRYVYTENYKPRRLYPQLLVPLYDKNGFVIYEVSASHAKENKR